MSRRSLQAQLAGLEWELTHDPTASSRKLRARIAQLKSAIAIATRRADAWHSRNPGRRRPPEEP